MESKSEPASYFFFHPKHFCRRLCYCFYYLFNFICKFNLLTEFDLNDIVIIKSLSPFLNRMCIDKKNYLPIPMRIIF